MGLNEGDGAKRALCGNSTVRRSEQHITTFLISRHSAFVEWATIRGIRYDEWIEHLDPEIIQPGDVVIGVLPICLADEIVERGAEVHLVCVSIPEHLRGHELSARQMIALGAELREYKR